MSLAYPAAFRVLPIGESVSRVEHSSPDAHPIACSTSVLLFCRMDSGTSVADSSTTSLPLLPLPLPAAADSRVRYLFQLELPHQSTSSLTGHRTWCTDGQTANFANQNIFFRLAWPSLAKSEHRLVSVVCAFKFMALYFLSDSTLCWRDSSD